MSEKLQMEKAFLDIRGHVAALNDKLIHYKITCNIDGGCVLKNSEQGEVIPILCFVNSISKSASPEDLENEIILKIRLPFIVGYYHGKHKPSSVEDLLKDFISELIKLHPDNHGPETEGRKCTCTIYSSVSSFPPSCSNHGLL
jgi:hypothetical protein